MKTRADRVRSLAHKRLIMGFKRAAPPPPPPASYYDSLMGFMGLDSPPPATLIDDVKNCVASYGAICETKYLVAAGVVALTLLYLLRSSTKLDPVSAKLRAVESMRRQARQEIIILTFRALKAVAMADGVFHKSEEQLLYSILEELPDLLEIVPDLDQIFPITPDELAEKTERLAGPGPKSLDYMRLRLLTLMCHVALVDGVEDKAETQLIGEFAAAFGFPPSWMNQVRQSVVARQPKKAGKAPATKEKGAARPELVSARSLALIGSDDFCVVFENLCHR